MTSPTVRSLALDCYRRAAAHAMSATGVNLRTRGNPTLRATAAHSEARRDLARESRRECLRAIVATGVRA